MMCAIRIVQKPRLPAKPGDDEQGQQRGAHHDLGRGHRQEDQQVGRPTGRGTGAAPARRPSACPGWWRPAVARKPIWMLRTTESHMPLGLARVQPVVQGEPVELVAQPREAGSLNDIRITTKIGRNM